MDEEETEKVAEKEQWKIIPPVSSKAIDENESANYLLRIFLFASPSI